MDDRDKDFLQVVWYIVAFFVVIAFAPILLPALFVGWVLWAISNAHDNRKWKIDPKDLPSDEWYEQARKIPWDAS